MMASELFSDMQNEMEEFRSEYNRLKNEFRRTGDDDLFVDFDEKLLRLRDKAMKLPNLEERLEVIGFAKIYYDSVKLLTFYVVS